MQIIIDEGTRCVKPIGRIDSNTCEELDRAIVPFTEDGRDIILDMSGCVYLSSAGIRILMKTKKKLLASQNELFLAGLAPEILRVLEMAGLDQLFAVRANVASALTEIRSSGKTRSGIQTVPMGHHELVYQPSGAEHVTGQVCREPEVLSYHELGFSLGFGSLSSNAGDGSQCSDFFATLGHVAGFLPGSMSAEPDFRISADPSKSGLQVCEAISFGSDPTGYLKLSKSGIVLFSQINEAMGQLGEEAFPKDSLTLRVVANFDREKPSLSLVLPADASLRDLVSSQGMERIGRLLNEDPEKRKAIGVTFMLSDLNLSSKDLSLQELLRQKMTIDNILGVEPLTQGRFLENPVVWLFRVNAFINGHTTRLNIETRKGSALNLHKVFLARLLYSDSSKIQLDALEGGYVADTFQVTSFDHEGRKMRPTVLKIARRDLIARESERCRQYALPYIFNNSAVVLGAEYFEDIGALRYNFVGLGGESGQLKWLKHFYENMDTAALEPLFDKIFTQILKPWYGQPVSKTIFPFKDHDPTLTFFPNLCKTAQEVLGISSDEEFISIPEKEKPVLNPYWFLKHEYARRREEGMEYFTGICHGDLNMQNILLDESMNVYLIDFSETRPRSIISDFARLEAIFMTENIPVETDEDLKESMAFLADFYRETRLDHDKTDAFPGRHSGIAGKNIALTSRMRKYAIESANGNPDAIPYYAALLEWILPVVCFRHTVLQKRLSMYVASVLCEKLRERG